MLSYFHQFDFSSFQRCFSLYQPDHTRNYENFSPLPHEEVLHLDELSHSYIENCIETGLELLNRKEVALILLAGGDGSRLNCTLPKLIYPLKLQESKTLAELFIKRVQGLMTHYNISAESPIYFIISSQMRTEIKEFFLENKHFGYKNLVFYETSKSINITNLKGQILFDKKSEPLRSSFGNGDLTSCLNRGLLEDLKSNGVRVAHISNIDNILFKPLDPLLIGMHRMLQTQILFKTVEKVNPEENVGIHGKNEKGFEIHEYLYMDDETRRRKTQDGALSFRYANIMNFAISIDALELISSKEKEMSQLNFVLREFDSMDLDTGEVQKTKCVKLERFFMDFFPYLKSQEFLEVNRAEEFAAIKGLVGLDTPSYAYSMLSKMNQRKLGWQLEGKLVEIPQTHFYLDRKEIESKREEIEKEVQIKAMPED